MLSRALASALVLGVVLGAVVACSDQTPASGGGGLDVLEGSDARAVTGTEVPVLVPGGSFVFTVGEPLSDLPDDAEDPATDGSGTTYVGIAWRPEGNAPEFGPVLHGTAPLSAPVRVVQGEETAAVTELGADTGGGNANGVVWVAVDEDGPDPVLEVEYDGLVQTFDLTTGERATGPADGFYDDTGTVRPECQDGTQADGAWRLQVGCAVTEVASVPYVAGQGWAEEGNTWLVLGVTLTTRGFTWTGGSTPAGYEIVGQQGEVTADGRPTVVLSEDAPLGYDWSASLAVTVDAAEAVTLDVRRSYDLALDSDSPADEDTPTTGTATYTATISLPPSTR